MTPALSLGDTVRVTGAFAYAFPDPLIITDIVVSGDQSVTYILGEAGGFDAQYLERTA